MDSAADTPCGVGCPIRRSPDQSLLAAPRGLTQRATSFIASRRQGIHQMPFSHSPAPAGRAEGQRTEARGQMSEETSEPMAAVIDRCTANRGKTSIPMPGTATCACSHEERRTGNGTRASQPAAGGQAPTAGCTSPPYDVTCKRKVAVTTATQRAHPPRRMAQAHPSPRPEARFPSRARPRRESIGRAWWARADLNGRPHAYQACALTS